MYKPHSFIKKSSEGSQYSFQNAGSRKGNQSNKHHHHHHHQQFNQAPQYDHHEQDPHELQALETPKYFEYSYQMQQQQAHSHLQQQEQCQEDLQKEYLRSLTSCQEIFNNHISIICEFDSLPTSKEIPQQILEGLDNRIKLNYQLLYYCIESNQKKKYYAELREQLLAYVINTKPEFEKEQSFQAFNQFVNNLEKMESPTQIEVQGRVDQASVNLTMMEIAAGINKIDERKGEKSHFDFKQTKAASKKKMLAEIEREAKGLPNDYQLQRKLFDKKPPSFQ